MAEHPNLDENSDVQFSIEPHLLANENCPGDRDWCCYLLLPMPRSFVRMKLHLGKNVGAFKR